MFCETNYFTVEDTDRILEAGVRFGLVESILVSKLAMGYKMFFTSAYFNCGSKTSISKLSTNAHLILDGDAAGKRAAIKNAQALIKMGFFVELSLLPDKEDPDTFFSSTEPKEWLLSNTYDFIFNYGSRPF